jgi:hypothetical protein
MQVRWNGVVGSAVLVDDTVLCEYEVHPVVHSTCVLYTVQYSNAVVCVVLGKSNHTSDFNRRVLYLYHTYCTVVQYGYGTTVLGSTVLLYS